MWFTAMSGFPLAKAKAFAAEIPIKRAPTSPGPYVTAIASMSSNVLLAFTSASSMTCVICSTWWRLAISGTTPPKRI